MPPRLSTGIESASYEGKKDAPLRSYRTDKQNNASSVRSGASVRNGRDEIYCKATEFVCLEKLDGGSGQDTAGPSTTSPPEIVSHASSIDGHGELKTPPVHCQEQRECVVTPFKRRLVPGYDRTSYDKEIRGSGEAA
jgi:hypothetical protein